MTNMSYDARKMHIVPSAPSRSRSFRASDLRHNRKNIQNHTNHDSYQRQNILMAIRTVLAVLSL